MSDCMNRRCPNVAEIERLTDRIEQLEALADARLKDRLIMQESNVTAHKRIEQLEALLKVAKCPDPNCEDGVVQVFTGEVYQCQWCDERAALEDSDE